MTTRRTTLPHTSPGTAPLQRMSSTPDFRSNDIDRNILDTREIQLDSGFQTQSTPELVPPELSDRERNSQRHVSQATVVFRPLAAVSPLSHDLNKSRRRHEAASSKASVLYSPNDKDDYLDGVFKENFTGKEDEPVTTKLAWYKQKASLIGTLFKNMGWKAHLIGSLIIGLITALVIAIVVATKQNPDTVKKIIDSMPPADQLPFLHNLTALYTNGQNKAAGKSSLEEGSSAQSDGNLLDIKDGTDVSSLFSVDLHLPRKPFQGVAYAPFNSSEPDCGFTKEAALKDMALLAQVTTSIKTYGVQCNQLRYTLDAIRTLSVPMKVAAGVWLSNDERVNQAQMREVYSLLREYPEEMFEAVFIGNEVLFRLDMTEDHLIAKIKEVKSFLLEINKSVPVGTCEIGALVSQDLLANCDVVGVNVHPFFGGVPVDQSVKWVYDFLDQQIQPRNLYNTTVDITEVGWPYKGGSYQLAFADPVSYEFFMRSWVCQPPQNKYKWFYFEAFDEPWKLIFHTEAGQWETEWGIFDKDKNLKIDLSHLSCGSESTQS